MSRAAVEGLTAIHREFRAVIGSLSDDEWALPSACAGWRVQDLVAHVTSNLKELVAPTPQATTPSVLRAEQAMEALVEPRKAWSPAQVIDEYEAYAEPALAALGAMQDEPTASTEVALADLGTYAMHWLANAYCFDHYCHLRHDLLAPGGSVRRPLRVVDDAMVRPGIDWMMHSLPQMRRGQFSSLLQPIRLELTGPGGGSWTLHPAGVDGLIAVTETASLDAAATVTSTGHDFIAWGTKRTDWRPSCAVAGDIELGALVLDSINII